MATLCQGTDEILLKTTCCPPILQCSILVNKCVIVTSTSVSVTNIGLVFILICSNVIICGTLVHHVMANLLEKVRSS